MFKVQIKKRSVDLGPLPGEQTGPGQVTPDISILSPIQVVVSFSGPTNRLDS